MELRSEVVRLNVGGVVYVTTAATLRSRGENFFTGLLDRSREWATHDGDGALFVDRNGHHFGPVLDFLRTGRLVVPPGMDRSAVEAECNFYLIELPADARPQHLDKWDTCVLQWRCWTQTRPVQRRSYTSVNTLLIKSADFVTSVTEQHCEFKLSESESHEEQEWHVVESLKDDIAELKETQFQVKVHEKEIQLITELIANGWEVAYNNGTVVGGRRSIIFRRKLH